MGDATANSSSTTASAGEDVELECVVQGGNPPSRARYRKKRFLSGLLDIDLKQSISFLRWLAGDQEIETGHSQENSKGSNDARTWTSVSRLTLPVSKADNGVVVRCLAEHPTLEMPLSAKTELVIHCK